MASLVPQVSLVPRSPPCWADPGITPLGIRKGADCVHATWSAAVSRIPAFHQLQLLSPPAQVSVQTTGANLGHSSISSTPQFPTSPLFFSHPFAKRRAKKWGTWRGIGMRFRGYFSVGAPAFMRGKERFSAPVKVRLRSTL